MADFGSLGFTSNPYLDQQVQDSLGDTVKAWNMVQQPAFNAAMVRSGSFGNEGINQMNQYGQQQLQNTLGRQANDMRSNNLWQGLGFDAQNYWNNQNFDKNVYDTTFAQNQQNFNNGLNVLGMMQGAGTQNLGLGTQIQNTPLNYYGQFANQANSFGQGYGTQTSSMTAQGSPLMGALGGYQLYNAFNKNGGWGTGGSSAPASQYNPWTGASSTDIAYG